MLPPRSAFLAILASWHRVLSIWDAVAGEGVSRAFSTAETHRARAFSPLGYALEQCFAAGRLDREGRAAAAHCAVCHTPRNQAE